MSVTLKCFKENNRLRIKIITPGYIQSANCMFPKNIRVEGQEYTVPVEDIVMADTKGKFFYRIKKNNITLKNNLDNLVVYGGDCEECAICMETYDEYMIFVPCGHYCCCRDCSKQIKQCCMCRVDIKHVITRDQLQ
jgi:hypothetical protein